MLFVIVAFATTVAAPPPAHSVDFWRGVVKAKYEVPAGESAPALAGELVDLLASPDPELRDEIAYSTLTSWIYEKKIIDPDGVRAIGARLTQNIRMGIGERGTDSVFRRSFSALMLSVVIARDNATPFLLKGEVTSALTSALDYLKAEQDVRGYEPGKGWMHSAAHTADLLKFLARSRHLDAADQPRILDAITRKLADGPGVYTHGEDERFARAVLSIVNRVDFDRDGFKAWAGRAKPAPIRTSTPTPAQLAGAQNAKNLLSKLEVILAVVPDASESIQFARDSVREVLRGLY